MKRDAIHPRLTRLRLVAAASAALTALGGFPLGARAAVPTELFISEYVEGSASNQALEIFNGTPTFSLVLDNQYSVEIYADGAQAPTATVALFGSIDPGDVFVVANALAGQALASLADQIDADLAFDGNDTIVLRNTAAGKVIDSIGRIGASPQGGWGSTEPLNTVDNTLRRRSTVTAGDVIATDVFDPAAEWDGYPVDTFDGLGAHQLTSGGGSGPDGGAVAATVTVEAAAACLQLSATSVDFGLLPLGAKGQPGTPTVQVTNCSTSSGTILARGTDATGATGSWNLDDSNATCGDVQAPLAADRYHLDVAPAGAAAVSLSTLDKSIQTLAAGAADDHELRISTACPGSTGAGEVMSLQVIYTATQ